MPLIGVSQLRLAPEALVPPPSAAPRQSKGIQNKPIKKFPAPEQLREPALQAAPKSRRGILNKAIARHHLGRANSRNIAVASVLSCINTSLIRALNLDPVKSQRLRVNWRRYLASYRAESATASPVPAAIDQFPDAQVVRTMPAPTSPVPLLKRRADMSEDSASVGLADTTGFDQVQDVAQGLCPSDEIPKVVKPTQVESISLKDEKYSALIDRGRKLDYKGYLTEEGRTLVVDTTQFMNDPDQRIKNSTGLAVAVQNNIRENQTEGWKELLQWVEDQLNSESSPGIEKVIFACTQGRHRSVAAAEILGNLWEAQIQHLSLEQNLKSRGEVLDLESYGMTKKKAAQSKIIRTAPAEPPALVMPCVKTGQLTSDFAAGGVYLGPQSRIISSSSTVRSQSSTLSIVEMLRWRSVAIEEILPSDTDLHINAEVFVFNVAVSVGGGGWREEAAKLQAAKARAKASSEQIQSDPDVSKILKHSEDAWAAQQKEHRRRLNAEGKSDAEIVRLMKSILNKLTIEKYDKLYQQLLICGMSEVSHVKVLIQEIMEKAQTQHNFIQMYAKLCADLADWFVENEISDAPEHGFKKILLGECQDMFERNLAPMDERSIKAEDLAEAQDKHKLSMLGNLKFIGALLERSMIKSSVVIGIAEDLLDEFSAPHLLESLACFLTSVGAKFDRPKWPHHERLKAIFIRVEEKRKDKVVPARIRFLLQDLLDLRASGWAEAGKVDGPMKIGDVHEKAAREKQDDSAGKLKRR